jgi:hypothetical protein
MRKISSGIKRDGLAYSLTLKGFPLGTSGAGRLVAIIPQSLLSLLGLRAGLSFKTTVRSNSLTLEPRGVSSSLFASPPRKCQGADRIRFERRLAKVVRALRPRPALNARGLRK